MNKFEGEKHKDSCLFVHPSCCLSSCQWWICPHTKVANIVHNHLFSKTPLLCQGEIHLTRSRCYCHGKMDGRSRPRLLFQITSAPLFSEQTPGGLFFICTSVNWDGIKTSGSFKNWIICNLMLLIEAPGEIKLFTDVWQKATQNTAPMALIGRFCHFHFIDFSDSLVQLKFLNGQKKQTAKKESKSNCQWEWIPWCNKLGSLMWLIVAL